MELNEMEKKLLFQVEGDYQTKILNELYMTVRLSLIHIFFIAIIHFIF